jgi:hypothetical protein
MSATRILFVHGRAQGGRTQAAIRDEWLAALREGLGDRASILDRCDIRLPFYGDKLDQLLAEAATALPADLRVRGDVGAADSEFLEFQLAIFEEAQRQEGLTDAQVAANMEGDHLERGPLQWRWVHAIMRTLNKIPGLDGDLIERFTKDVWIYLKLNGVRQAINDIVASEIAGGTETIVVAHSLGSVVAYDILRKTHGSNVPLFVTLGSPLGIDAIRARFSPLGHPTGVGSWFNARDDRDVVALYPLRAPRFALDPAIDHYDGVRNRSPNAHHISGYLNDAKVAERILSALG